MNLNAEPTASELGKRCLVPGSLIYQTQTCFVYRIYDQGRGKPAVLKLLLRSMDSDPIVAQREVTNQWRCVHPNIVELYDSFWYQVNSSYWIGAIEMEVMATDLGKDIQNRYKNNYPWSEQELLKFLLDIVNALAYTQDLGIAHRDIKPQNLFLDRGTYKVGDFGSSKDLLRDKTLMTLAGTVLYLSPILRKCIREKYVVHNPFKSDIFSLGLSLLHMAKLQPIPPLGNIEQQIFPAISSLQYSDQLKGWLGWMLAIEESDRPDFVTMRKYLCPIEHEIANHSDEVMNEVDPNPQSDSPKDEQALLLDSLRIYRSQAEEMKQSQIVENPWTLSSVAFVVLSAFPWQRQA
jgi:serine/threonine protein kinase